MNIIMTTFFVRNPRIKNDLETTYFILVSKGKLDYICPNYLKLIIDNG